MLVEKMYAFFYHSIMKVLEGKFLRTFSNY